MLSIQEVKEINEKNRKRKVGFLEVKSIKKIFGYSIIIKNNYIDEKEKKLNNKGVLNPVINKGVLQITIPEWDNFLLVMEKERDSIIIYEKDGRKRNINLKNKDEFSLGIYLD